MGRDKDAYFGDLIYEVWRQGGNPDAVDRDQARDFEQLGYYPEDAAAALNDKQRRSAVNMEENDD